MIPCCNRSIGCPAIGQCPAHSPLPVLVFPDDVWVPLGRDAVVQDAVDDQTEPTVVEHHTLDEAARHLPTCAFWRTDGDCTCGMA